MAHKKGVGSSKNGRESHSKRLGVKIFGGQIAKSGNIIVRQRGTVHYPGENVYLGKDHTLHAKESDKPIAGLIQDLKEVYDNGTIFITHDFGIVADIADRVAVMCQGKIIEQDSEVDFLKITKPVVYTDEEKDVEVLAVPYNGFKTTFTIQYDLEQLDVQYSSVQNMYTNYETQIAPARTFCLLSEIAGLEKQGLIKGGNLGNAVIIVDTEIDADEVNFFKKRFGIKFYEGNRGLYKSQILRFKNEPVRHKTLDLLGDLALLGKPILGHVTAIKSGHKGNVEFAKLLREEFKDQFS